MEEEGEPDITVESVEEILSDFQNIQESHNKAEIQSSGSEQSFEENSSGSEESKESEKQLETETGSSKTRLARTLFQCFVAIGLTFTILGLVIALSFRNVEKVYIEQEQLQVQGCPFQKYALDGICQDEANTPDCLYDGGDCCRQKKSTPSCKNCTCQLNTTREQLDQDFERYEVMVYPGPGDGDDLEMSDVVTINNVESVDVCSQICMDSTTKSLVDGWAILPDQNTTTWRDHVNAWRFQTSDGQCTCQTILGPVCHTENAVSIPATSSELMDSFLPELIFIQMTKTIPCDCLVKNVLLEPNTNQGNISKILAQSSWHCQKACHARTGCKYFSFNAKQRTQFQTEENCYLLFDNRIDLRSTFEPGWVSGLDSCNNANTSDLMPATTLKTTTTTPLPYNHDFNRILVTAGKTGTSESWNWEICTTEILDLVDPELICDDYGSIPHTLDHATGGLLFYPEDQGAAGTEAVAVVCAGYMWGISEISADCHSFDESYEASTQVGALNHYRNHPASIVMDQGRTLWITGGRSSHGGDNFPMDSTEFLNLIGPDAGLSSKDGPKLPVGLLSHCLVILEKSDNTVKAIVIGGKSAEQTEYAEARTWHMDDVNPDGLNNNDWIQGPVLDYGRVSHSCGLLLDQSTNEPVIVIAGGSRQYYHEAIQAVEYLVWRSDLELERQDGTSLPVPLMDCASIVTPDLASLLLIGGTAGVESDTLDTIYTCTMTAMDCIWTLMDQRLKDPRSRAVAMLVPDSMTRCLDKTTSPEPGTTTTTTTTTTTADELEETSSEPVTTTTSLFDEDYYTAISGSSMFVVAAGKDLFVDPMYHDELSEVINFNSPVSGQQLLANFPYRMEKATGGLVRGDDEGNLVPLICGGLEVMDHHGFNGEQTDRCFMATVMEEQDPDVMTEMPVKLIQARRSASSVVINDGQTLWITGGWKNEGLDQKLDSTEFIQLFPAPVSIQGPKLPATSYMHCIMMVNASHALLTFGIGMDPPHTSQESWFYDLDKLEDEANEWQRGPDLNAQRLDHTCGVLYDKELELAVAIVAGGKGPFSAHVDTVEFLWLELSLDLDQLQWTNGPNLPVATRAAVSIVTPDQSSFIYIGGCHDCYNENNFKSMFMCSMIGGTCSWIVMEQELAVQRAYGVAILLPPNYYFPMSTTSGPDLATLTDSTEHQLTQADSNPVTILVTTGVLPATDTTSVETIDITTHSDCGTNVFPSHYPIAVGFATAGLVKQSTADDDDDESWTVLVCGGLDRSTYISRGECYSLEPNQVPIQEVLSMLTPRYYASSIVIDSGKKLWITGGLGGIPEEKLDTTEYITLMPEPTIQEGPKMPWRLHGHCLLLLNGSHALIVGGYNNFQSWADSRTWYINVNTMDQWTFGPEMNTGRVFLSCGVLHDKGTDAEVAIVAGGTTFGSMGLKTMEHLWINDIDIDNAGFTDDGASLCLDTVGASSVVSPDRSSLLVVGGMGVWMSTFHDSVCSCAMFNGISTCSLLDQTMEIRRAFAIAILIPDTMTTC